MKKEFLLIGIWLLFFASCKKNDNVEGSVITINETKLSKISNIFMQNNAAEVIQGNPFNENELAFNYEFELGDYNNDGEVDLYAIKKYNIETNSTDIHILSGASNYKSSLLKAQTALNDTDANYEFELGDYNNDGKIDLYAIKKHNGETNFADIHILSGASNYKSSLLKTQTVLNDVDSSYKFKLGDYNNDGKIDLYTLKEHKVKANFTEIHILSGASNYTSSLLKTETVLNDMDSNYEFELDDYNDDGKIDLYALKKDNIQTNFAEIHILSGAKNYTSSLLVTDLVLNKVDFNYEFKLSNKRTKLYAHKKRNSRGRLTSI